MPKIKANIKLIVLTVVILLAIFYRFWEIRDYVVFLGDEGRDMIILRNMIVDGNIPFLGPTASVGGFYLGPIYYWISAPFLLLWRFDPIGPSYMVALFGVLTVIIIYKFLKDAVGFWPAILAASLYAVAPLIVRYSRSAWNPNPLPFFSILMLYFIYLAIRKNKQLFYLCAGACFGIAIQLHYLAIALIPISGLIILLNTNIKSYFKTFIIIVVGSLITFAPFLLFEIKHNFPNFTTIIEFVTRDSNSGFKTSNLITLVADLGNILLQEISLLRNTVTTLIIFWILTMGSILGLLLNRKSDHKRLVYSIGLIWFLGGLLTLRFYSGQIFDYYFGFMFPAPFFLIGLIFALGWKNNILKIVISISTVIMILYFISVGYYMTPPNRLINQTELVANFVIEKANNEPYNFALLSEGNSDHAYRYFLETNENKPIDLETIITNQLLIVCEAKKCEPLGHPTWEIAGFGRAEIKGDWELPEIGIRVLHLTHWPGVPSPAGKPAIKGE